MFPNSSGSERVIAAQRVTIEQQAEMVRHLRRLLEGEVDDRTSDDGSADRAADAMVAEVVPVSGFPLQFS